MNKRKKESKEDAFLRCCNHLLEMVKKYGEEAIREDKESQGQEENAFQISFLTY